LELGLTPGTEITVVGVSPLGDPLELAVRGSRVSIRKKDALEIEVEALGSPREQNTTARERGVNP
jgi:Fe2+ transport system protein FeoA